MSSLFTLRMKTKIEESCLCTAYELCIMQEELCVFVGGEVRLLPRSDNVPQFTN